MIMKYIDSDPVSEVRRNREFLLEKYSGIDGLLKHMDEERPKLEEQGWHFVSTEDVIAKKYGFKIVANAKENKFQR